MNLFIDFDPQLQNAIVRVTDVNRTDFSSLLRMLNDYVPGYIQKGSYLFLDWRSFLLVRIEIAKFAKSHTITIELTNEIKQRLIGADVQSHSFAIKQKPIDRTDIEHKLSQVGFERQLTSHQLSNLCTLGPLPSGATFSVPGAGKTTEALAYFFFNAVEGDRLLVIAPKNAFGAWDEQLIECIPTEKSGFVRLRGGEKRIESMLLDKPKYMIITYQQFPRVKHLLRDMLQKYPVFMYLDESHRIKSGKSGVSADAILDVSYLPKRKLIMSGTPMPQSIRDVIPQFSFLYPEKRISEDSVLPLLRPVYVRTTKGQLGIPLVDHRLILLKMDVIQEQVYQSIKSEVKRQLIPFLSDAARYSLREISKRVIKVMQFVSNPALLISFTYGC